MIKVKILNEHGSNSLVRGSTNAVGYDVASAEPHTRLDPGESKLFSTGIALEMPAGIECQVRPRSGFSIKNHVIIPNSPGTLDPDFRGEVKVCLMNLGHKAVIIDQGQRIAQLVFNQVHLPEFEFVDELSDTKRGTGGFGSTGK